MGCLVWSVFGSALLPEPTQPAVSPHRPPSPCAGLGQVPAGLQHLLVGFAWEVAGGKLNTLENTVRACFTSHYSRLI